MNESATNWLDRLTLTVAPRWTMRRIRARAAIDVFTRSYEAAVAGRRTQGWRRSSGDANSSLMQGLSRLREDARDVVRNNAYGESAVATIADHAVGWGIVAKPSKETPRLEATRFTEKWKAWAETTACDAEGRLDFAGIQKLAMRSVAESGEIMIRRRWRRPEDNLPLNFQLQILESDYLDSSKDGISTPGGGTIVQGVEYDAIGRRSRYWLFREHPGSNFSGLRSSGPGQSQPVSASEILHVFPSKRPGQARGASWFAPVMLRMKDFDEYEDAALMKQKIAACLAVLTTDVDGTTTPLGGTNTEEPTWDMLYPGMIKQIPGGQAITVVEPPSVSEHDAYAKTVLRAIATGLGVTYEDLTGDYTGMPYSAARMSRIRHWARVEDWRWRMLIPQLCDPVWAWAVEAARVGNIIREPIKAEWTAPPMPMIEPDVEARSYQMRLRIGAITWPEMIRELGYDPDQVFEELVAWNKKFDAAEVILDGDPRATTQQGGPRDAGGAAGSPEPAVPAASSANGSARSNGNGHHPPAPEDGWKTIERTLSRLVDARDAREQMPAPNVNVTVPFADGAIRLEPAAAPEINVDARTSISDGAVRVEVAPPPPAEIHVEAPEIRVEPAVVNIERGAVQVDVDAPTTIAEGALTVTPSTPPQITVVRTPRKPRGKPPTNGDE